MLTLRFRVDGKHFDQDIDQKLKMTGYSGFVWPENN